MGSCEQPRTHGCLKHDRDSCWSGRLLPLPTCPFQPRRLHIKASVGVVIALASHVVSKTQGPPQLAISHFLPNLLPTNSFTNALQPSSLSLLRFLLSAPNQPYHPRSAFNQTQQTNLPPNLFSDKTITTMKRDHFKHATKQTSPVSTRNINFQVRQSRRRAPVGFFSGLV